MAPAEKALIKNDQNNSDPACEQSGYVDHVIDVSTFADGGMHTLRVYGETQGGQGGPPGTRVTNFFVDDVTLVSCP